jgi:hypothetical protein
VPDSAKIRAAMCKCEECLGGYLSFGQGRSDAEDGDVVCILLGYAIPMLVKKDAEKWNL